MCKGIETNYLALGFAFFTSGARKRIIAARKKWGYDKDLRKNVLITGQTIRGKGIRFRRLIQHFKGNEKGWKQILRARKPIKKAMETILTAKNKDLKG